MMTFDELISQHLFAIADLKVRGYFFETSIIKFLNQIEQYLLNNTDIDSIIMYLKNEKQNIENVFGWLPLKNKTIDLIKDILNSLEQLKTASQNKLENITSAFYKIPDEILSTIFQRLNIKDLIAVSQSTTRFHGLVKKNPFTFWPKLHTGSVKSLEFKTCDTSSVVDIKTYTKYVVSLHANGRVYIWDRNSGYLLHSMDYEVTAIAKSNDLLWLGMSSGRIFAWNMNQNKKVMTIQANNFPVKTLANYERNKLILNFTDKYYRNKFTPQFCILDPKTRRLSGHKLVENSYNNFQLLSSTKNYIVSSRGKMIFIWYADTLNLKVRWRNLDCRYSVQQMFVHDDNLILHYTNNIVCIYEIDSGNVTKLEDYPAVLKCINIVNECIVLGYLNGTIRLYDMNKHRFLPDLKIDFPISFVTGVSTNQLLIGSTTGHIKKLTLHETDYDFEIKTPAPQISKNHLC